MAFPFYKQRDLMDCGPTCLAMIARFYKKQVSIHYLREKMQATKEGVSLLGIAEAATSLGFRASPLMVSLDTLTNDFQLPCILHWQQNHFVVLYKTRRNKFFIANPATGLVTLNNTEFSEKWANNKKGIEAEGIALLLDPLPSFNTVNEVDILPKSSANGGLGFQSLLQYIRPYKKLLLQLFIGIAIGLLLQLALPFLTQSIIDTGVKTGNLHFIHLVLLGQLALFAGRLAIEFIRSWILLHISIRINISILTDFLIKLMKLPVSFFDSKLTGDIMQRMNDHSRIESFLTGSSLNTLFSLLNLVIFSIVLAVFNTTIFTVFVFASVVYAAWVMLLLKKRKLLDYQRFDLAAKEQANTIQLVQGMQEIKLHGAERAMRWAWERLQAKIFTLNSRNLVLNQWQQAGALFINEGKNIFITFLSAKAVIDEQMTLGSMLAIQYIIGQLNSPIEQVIGFLQNWQNAKISMDRLNEIHLLDDEEPAAKMLQQTLPAGFQKMVTGGRSINVNDEFASMHKNNILSAPSIFLNNISFTYPGVGNEPVLKDITLRIDKGTTTAIVGTSGSGKTTLLKLLLKFYTPQAGEIFLDDILLDDVSHRTWRKHCGVVMQDSFIFSDTIANNIAIGQDMVDRQSLERAAGIANIGEFINGLPLTYNTKIGSEGAGISMGQRQRILIARAVYCDPQFIFFDEATNSLDANNESEIIQKLNDFFKGRTVIIVAHRLSTVRNADQIIVLNKGTICEKGTHEQLVNLRGTYYQLVKNQLELAI